MHPRASSVVGSPVDRVGGAHLARRREACRTTLRQNSSRAKAGDIVKAAVGRPELIRGDWIKPGAVVMDAGYNVGDVEQGAAAERTRLLTPVPGAP